MNQETITITDCLRATDDNQPLGIKRSRSYPKTFGTTFLLSGVLWSAAISQAGNVVTDWNNIASTTIVKNGGKGAGSSAIWFAYTNLAVYDAVNAITGQYRTFYYKGTGPQTASVDAAAAAAAHRVLVNYFPAQKSDLDASFAASLSNIGADPTAKAAGVSVGEAAAASLIAARTADGLEANVPYVPGSGMGVWIPTPPAFLAGATPWLGFMRPFTMSTAGDFLPDGATRLGSEPWKRDYNLTRLLGGANSTIRSAAESEIALFWTEHTGQQFARALGNLAETNKLSPTDTARFLAMVWTGSADSLIACYNAKYNYGFWRPVTAIPAGGGNSDMQADSAWLPLATTPNHPEYPSGHACFTGAATTMIAAYFGTTKTPVVVDSTAFQDGLHTHTFEDTRDLMDEVFWARIYSGIHFYHSMADGRQLGTTVSREMLRTHFRLQQSGLEPAAVKK